MYNMQKGITPLHSASRTGHRDVIKEIVSRAEVDKIDSVIYYPIHNLVLRPLPEVFNVDQEGLVHKITSWNYL